MIKKNTAFSLLELSIVLLIIGIAVASVGLSSRLITEYRLGLARSMTKSSDAAAISGMILWLDATAEKSMTNTSNSTVLNNNDNIKTWLDQNPQLNEKFTFTEKAAGEGPIYVEKGINNLPSLYFDFVSSSSLDGFTAPYSTILNPDQFTIFVVAQPLENTGQWGTLLMSRDAVSAVGSGGYSGFNLYKVNTDAKFSFWTGSGNSWNTATDSSDFSYNNSYIVTCIRTGIASNDNNIIYRNGTQTGIDFSNNFLPNGSSAEPTAIFRIGNSYDGYISEIIIYNRYLKPEERQVVEAYLSKKYNIKLN